MPPAQLASDADGDLRRSVVAHWFGFTAEDIPEGVQNSLLNIVMVGVGGYVAGRWAEKVADKWKDK